MKRILALLLASVMLLSLAACQQNEDPVPSGTEPTTESVGDEMEHFDLNEIDLDGIGQLLVERQQDGYSKLQLDGLCTPVILELEGTDVETVTAYGTTVCVAEEANDYSSIYGNLWPVIYEQDGLIFLNIWHDEIGYSCVLCPDGSFMENYPSGDFSVMIYVDEEGQMCQYQFARKFLGIEQWDTGPIDTATSRDDFYYSIDDATWTRGEYSITARESYTISDCFELEEIFSTAKAQGLYPEFDTLDELLASNAVPSFEGPDSSQETVRYFDSLFAVYDYDSQRNLLNETFYTLGETVYFERSHRYDDRNREVAGIWSFRGEEAYRYTNTYDEQDRLTETVWYQDEQEVERFTYTYDGQGGHTETFAQNGKKMYTYTFDKDGELTAHSVYQNGREVKTEDVTTLVKTPLLTDIYLPIIDNEPLHFAHYYNGTAPAEDRQDAQCITADDGSYILLREAVDEEDGQLYRHEYRYDVNHRLLQESHSSGGVEYLRDEYRYDSDGLCIQQITYLDGEKDMVCENQYDQKGQLIQQQRTYTTPQSYYIYTDENGEAVEKEVTYTVKTEAYRYNVFGQLKETVTSEDGVETDRTAYRYDANGYVLPRLETYMYDYSEEGILEEIWLICEDYASGVAHLRSRIVYVTPENARQLQEILRNELSWL